MTDSQRFHVLSESTRMSPRVVVYDVVGGHGGFTDAYKVLFTSIPMLSIIILGLGPVSSGPL